MLRIRSSECVLLIIDVQDKIVNTVADRANVLHGLKALISSSRILNIPIMITEQQKMGELASEINLPDNEVVRFKKITFSCCDVSEFRNKLQTLGRKSVLVCGVETHICVMQTVLDLLDMKYEVLILRDLTSSHGIADRETAIERMRQAGAVISTTEAVIFELMGDAARPEFKRILQIIKDFRSGDDITL